MSWSAVIIVSCVIAYVHAHGRVVDPPNRASLWRYGYDAPPNYDDDGLNCGGFYHQWSANHGKCGICGDPYDAAEPRPHELGGKYGLGYIVEEYTPGEVISTTVYISAYHKGFWEFKICPDPYSNDQECFDEHVLELENGGTKYYPPSGGTFDVKYRLPSNLVCEHCVLQWRYTAGNNWGNCGNGTEGVGCGNQENFLTCSDIAIIGDVPETHNTKAPEIDIPMNVPILELNGGLLRLLMMTNEIQDVRPSYTNISLKKKYLNKHKLKKANKKSKRRKFKKFLFR